MTIRNIKIVYYIITPAISLLALYISIWGYPLAKPNIEPFIRDKCALSQHYGVLNMEIPFNFQNKGNAIGTISKMELLLKRDNSKYEKKLRWIIPPVSINSSNYISLEVKFVEKLDNAVDNETFQLTNNAMKESNALFLNDPNKKIYLISNKLFENISSFVKMRLADFNYGKYILIIKGWERYDNSKPLFDKKYEFDISESQIKLLKEYQIESYRTHPQFNDKFIVYSITPDLKEIK